MLKMTFLMFHFFAFSGPYPKPSEMPQTTHPFTPIKTTIATTSKTLTSPSPSANDNQITTKDSITIQNPATSDFLSKTGNPTLTEEHSTISNPVSSPNGSICTSGWSLYGDQCYLFVAPRRTIVKGGLYCNTQGAHLVSIHSPQENDWLLNM